MKPDTPLDREIEAMLAVDPSHDFVSRVRTRIAGQPVPFWTFGWTSLAAGSVVVAVVVAVAVSGTRDNVRPEAVAPISKTTMQLDSLSDDLPAPPHLNPAKSPEIQKLRVSKTALRDPEMLINPEESAAIRHFLSHPQPELFELSLVKIEPQPLPEFTFTPLPTFDPMSVLQGDFK
jgi:hypothetical protein